jgi:hypothetical protein
MVFLKQSLDGNWKDPALLSPLLCPDQFWYTLFKEREREKTPVDNRARVGVFGAGENSRLMPAVGRL